MGALEEIRGRWEKATPGPWKLIPNGRNWAGVNGPVNYIVSSSTRRPDAEFIAHAPEDMRRLLNAVEAVLGLHERIECTDEDGEPTGFFACEECKDHDEVSRERVHEVYPCPTVEAITSALEAKP